MACITQGVPPMAAVARFADLLRAAVLVVVTRQDVMTADMDEVFFALSVTSRVAHAYNRPPEFVRTRLVLTMDLVKQFAEVHTWIHGLMPSVAVTLDAAEYHFAEETAAGHGTDAARAFYNTTMKSWAALLNEEYGGHCKWCRNFTAFYAGRGVPSEVVVVPGTPSRTRWAIPVALDSDGDVNDDVNDDDDDDDDDVVGIGARLPDRDHNTNSVVGKYTVSDPETRGVQNASVPPSFIQPSFDAPEPIVGLPTIVDLAEYWGRVL